MSERLSGSTDVLLCQLACCPAADWGWFGLAAEQPPVFAEVVAVGACLPCGPCSGAELFNAALLTVGWDPEAAAAALPGTLAFLAIMGASGPALTC